MVILSDQMFKIIRFSSDTVMESMQPPIPSLVQNRTAILSKYLVILLVLLCNTMCFFFISQGNLIVVYDKT